MPAYRIAFTDDDLRQAYERMKDSIKHTDAPTEVELSLLREELPGQTEIISLHWLRNQLVRLRKQGGLGKQEPLAPLFPKVESDARSL